jgi:hypothetical protein
VPPLEYSPAAVRDFEAVLKRVQNRLRASAALRSAGVGLIAAPVLFLWLPISFAALASLALALFVLMTRRRSWTAQAAATSVERANPQSRNLVVTAEELRRYPDRATPRAFERVLADASAFVKTTTTSVAVPLGPDIAFSVAAAGILALTVLGVPERVTSDIRNTVTNSRGDSPDSGALRVVATVVPPSYLARGERTVENPDRIDAIAGSRLRISVSGAGDRRIRFGEQALTTSAADGIVRAELLLAESGYLAIDSAAGDASQRKLIAVAVTPDRSPVIRIDQPGKDLLVPDSRPTIPVKTSANDDFELRSLELRYTKVSGSGEQFEFEEGTLPLDISRQSGREWSGQASLALARLDLQPGDSVVYRVVGRDARPGDEGLASSDTFFVEVAGPGQVTLAGFELPPERERYALSQQMIVLKIQRLRAREQSLARTALVEETAAIAAEQRSVRANFIFLTGGQIEDEVEEAEHSHEIQEGRLENTARREIGIAIQHMGRADQSLMAVDTTAALAAARAAVEALQRAFGRNRYILRTLPVRSRVDPSRRLAGDLERASDASRDVPTAAPDRAALVSLRLIARLIEVKPALASKTRDAGSELTALAEEALSVDSGSESWQRISADLVAVRDLARAARLVDADAKLNDVLGRLVAEARKHAISIPTADEGDRALRSAWAFERDRR